MANNFQQRGLAVAVAANDADALAFVDAYGLVLEHTLSGPLVPDVLKSDKDSHVRQPLR